MNKFENLDGIVDIIVLIKIGDNYKWYCSDKILWLMDYAKYSHMFDPNDNDFSERFDIGLLDETTVELFMSNMEAYHCTVGELKNLFIKSLPLASFDEAYHLFPKLFIDFDARKLYSVYSELLQLQEYAPKGWASSYSEFSMHIPYNEQYWIIDNVDYLEVLT